MKVLKNKIPVREKAYQYLKTHILSGKFSPGEKLNQETLAKQLKISRTPIREALHHLHSEGLIDLSDTVGFRVAYLSQEELEELFDLRASLEGYLVRFVSKFISDDDLINLTDLIKLSEQALKEGSVDLVFKYNTKFHEILYRVAEQKRFTNNVILNMTENMLRYRRDTLHHHDAALRSIEGHKKILFAIKMRDPDLAEFLMKAHIHVSKADALRITFKNDSDEDNLKKTGSHR